MQDLKFVWWVEDICIHGTNDEINFYVFINLLYAIWIHNECGE